MKLNLFGEADELLARAHGIAPSPAILEMISYVAARKGEFARAEQACRSALEMDPNHAPSLLSLGWVFVTLNKPEKAREILRQLDKLDLKDETAKGRDELRTRLDDMSYMKIDCASCERNWVVKRESPPAPPIRLYAMPSDDLPAGSCLGCGKTYCIGCAKKNLDPAGRFICPICGKPLKLINEGLKRIIYDWAVKDGIIGKGKTKPAGKIEIPAVKTELPAIKTQIPAVKRGRGRPRKTTSVPAKTTVSASAKASAKEIPAKTSPKVFAKVPVPASAPVPDAAPDASPPKRGRGRPRKSG